MNKLEIIGWGSYLPEHTVRFNGQTRHRAAAGETQLYMAAEAARRALDKAGIAASDLDCIVSAAAVGVQPIPCTAALIHEQIALGTGIPALDINSTCTSFITALDTVSYLIAAGRYDTVLTSPRAHSIPRRAKVSNCSATARLPLSCAAPKPKKA